MYTDHGDSNTGDNMVTNPERRSWHARAAWVAAGVGALVAVASFYFINEVKSGDCGTHPMGFLDPKARVIDCAEPLPVQLPRQQYPTTSNP